MRGERNQHEGESMKTFMNWDEGVEVPDDFAIPSLFECERLAKGDEITIGAEDHPHYYHIKVTRTAVGIEEMSNGDITTEQWVFVRHNAHPTTPIEF